MNYFYYPAGWWQCFKWEILMKHRLLPGWWLIRHPLKCRKVKLGEEMKSKITFNNSCNKESKEAIKKFINDIADKVETCDTEGSIVTENNIVTIKPGNASLKFKRIKAVHYTIDVTIKLNSF